MGTLRNSVQLIGRPGSDPEIKVFGGEGRKMARFNLATNDRRYNEKHELVEETQWHNIVAWGATAEMVEKFVRKGKRIALDGHIQTRQYEDKNDKTKKYFTDIVIDEFMIIDWASTDEGQQSVE